MKRIAFAFESFELAHIFDLLLNRKSCHHAACSFGKKTDHFILAIFIVFKHALDHARLEYFAVHCFEIFLACSLRSVKN